MREGSVEILLRGMERGDVPFVTNSWLTNYRQRGRHVAGVESDVYYARHHKILEMILPRSTVLVACDPQMPQTIFGWCCAEVLDGVLTVHYVYVKEAFKARHDTGFEGLGIGTALLMAFVDAERGAGRPVTKLRCTHDTKSWREFTKALKRSKKLPSLCDVVYDPYYLYSSLPTGWASSR